VLLGVLVAVLAALGLLNSVLMATRERVHGLVLAASLSGHSSATSGIAAWLRLLTEPRVPRLPRPTDILA
jgi:hypothetical protein